MIVDDDHNYAADDGDDAYDALLTKNYGSCANASRLRLDPPESTKRRRSFAQRRRYRCLVYGAGLAFLVGGVFYVILRSGRTAANQNGDDAAIAGRRTRRRPPPHLQQNRTAAAGATA